MVLKPQTTDTQPANSKGIEISTPIRSIKSLKDWRGAYSTFDGFTGTRPKKEIDNAPWTEVRQHICPEEPALITDKHKAEYFIPCLLKNAPLVGKTLEKAEQKGEATNGKMRSKSHVTKSTMDVIDVDGITEKDFQAGLTKLENDGCNLLGVHNILLRKP